jgi:divalent metal cation (Fe/Co/Zn/Cd) transporter
MAGLIAVALGQPWGDPVAGLAVTAFIGHVGYEVTADVVCRLADGIDPSVISGAEAAAGSVPGVMHARARWTGRTLRIEIEGWVDPDLPVRDADELGCQVATALAREVPSRKPHLDYPRCSGLSWRRDSRTVFSPCSAVVIAISHACQRAATAWGALSCQVRD